MSKFDSTAILSIAGALLVGAATLLAATANAADGGYYRAELANPAPKAKFVARDVVWACDGANCAAGRGTSRPQLMCASLAKQAGQVKSFTANGVALAAEELARCNGGK